MTLSRRALLKRLEAPDWKRRLVIDPFFRESIDEASLSASLDFHLGNRFSVLRRRRAVRHDPLSPRQDVAPSELFVPFGADFLIHPGQLVLGMTLEWFRFPSDLMAYVIGRSIWGRRGLLIVTAAGVHPGSAGAITLELCNVGEVSIAVKPGVALGQLFFHQVQDVPPEIFRQSVFSGATHPILGPYHETEMESMLMAV